MNATPEKKSENFIISAKLISQLMAFFISIIGAPVLMCLSDHNTFALWQTMQFNAALLFAIFGMSIFLFLEKKLIQSQAVSLGIFFISSFTLLEYLLNQNFGIDELLHRAFDPSLQHPGRMALNTALALCTSSLSLFLLARVRPKGIIVFFSALFASFGVSLGLVKISGVAFDLNGAGDTESFMHISIPSAFGILIIGIFLLRACLLKLQKNQSESYRIIPLYVAAICIFINMILWQCLLNMESEHSKQIVSVETENMIQEIGERQLQISKAIQRLGSRIEYLGFSDKKYLKLEASSYIEQIPYIKRIGILDANSKVIWSYPFSIANQVSDLKQTADGNRKLALEHSKATRQVALSGVTNLLSGGLGFFMPVALFQNEKLVGYIYATIEATKLFGNLTDSNRFQMLIRMNQNKIFSDRKPNVSHSEFTQISKLKWGQNQIEIEVTPTDEFINANRSYISFFIFYGGIFISIFLGLFLQTLALKRKNELKFIDNEKLMSGRLNMALKSAEIAIWSSDYNSGELWRSSNHDELFGYRKRLDHWDREKFNSHILPEDLERIIQEQDQALFKSGVSKSEFRIKRADDQSIRIVRVQVRAVTDAQHKPKQLFGVISDVTQERKEEEQRIAALEWKKAILQATDYTIISTDENGIIQTFNSAAERMLGYEAEELIGKASPAQFHDVDEVSTRAKSLSREFGRNIEPGFEVFVLKARELQVADENEWSYLRKDGSRIPVSLCVTALRDPSGKVTGYLGIAIDLTERKRAEKLLSIAHERLERVVDATGEGIWEIEFNEKGSHFVNSQAKLIFGYEESDSPSYEEMLSWIHPHDRHQLVSVVKKHFRDKTPRFEFDFRILDRKSQTTKKWARAKGKVTEASGQPIRLVATISDITLKVEDRMRLEDALQKAEAGTQAKSTFLATMSHEIRTPLNGIIGMTDLLLDTKLDTHQKKYADIVQQSGANLLALINDVLDFSKIEANKLTLECAPFSLSSLIEAQVEVLIPRAINQKITLLSFISPNLPQNLIGDAGRVGQILVNLIGNAVKFTRFGGVSVRAQESKTRTAKIGTVWIRFEIEDTGIGISSEGITKLFKPFSQVDSGSTRQFGGTGLGLSISKRLVETMQGVIGIESIEGSGSTFWIEIPFEIAPQPNFVGVKMNSDEARQTQILIVDEDPIVTDVLMKYVVAFGFHAEACSPSAAPRILATASQRRRPFNLAILCASARPQDSFTLAREVNLAMGPNTPIFMLALEFGTKLSQGEDVENLFVSVLQKPFKLFDLVGSFSKFLNPEQASNKTLAVNVKLEAKSSLSQNEHFILVADDLSVNRMLTCKILESLGYSSHTAEHGLEVIAKMKENNFALILMDCQMPQLDGFATTKVIRDGEKATGKYQLIIALTANAMDGDSKKCVEAGMDDYLSKPIKKDKLKSMLEKWLSDKNTKVA